MEIELKSLQIQRKSNGHPFGRACFFPLGLLGFQGGLSLGHTAQRSSTAQQHSAAAQRTARSTGHSTAALHGTQHTSAQVPKGVGMVFAGPRCWYPLHQNSSFSCGYPLVLLVSAVRYPCGLLAVPLLLDGFGAAWAWGHTAHTHTAQRTAHSTGHSTAALHHSAQHVVKGTAKQHCTRQTAHTLLYMSARVAEGGFADLSFGIPLVLLAFALWVCLDFGEV